MNLAALEAQAREILERYDEPRAAIALVAGAGEVWPHSRRGGALGRAPSGSCGLACPRGGFVLFDVEDAASGPARASRLHEPALHVGGSRSMYSRIWRSDELGPGETTPDGQLTLTEVECLCACEMAPMVQLDEQFIGPLNGKDGTLDAVLGEALGRPDGANGKVEPQPFHRHQRTGSVGSVEEHRRGVVGLLRRRRRVSPRGRRFFP